MGSFPIFGGRVKTIYRVLIVRPLGEFKPTNWKHHPDSFEVVCDSKVGNTFDRGKADTFRFLFNKERLSAGVNEWAILETHSAPATAICRCCGVMLDMNTPDMMPSPQASLATS